MIWWRPAEQQRGSYRNWQAGKVWARVQMSFPAALRIYRHVCIIPMLFEPANDKDHVRW